MLEIKMEVAHLTAEEVEILQPKANRARLGHSVSMRV
jgi:hypothetical protein